jgi:hypothetical protein
MSDEIKDILSTNDGTPDEQQLLNYLEGNLPEEELHEIEMQMADSDFVNDAVEGLAAFPKGKDLNVYVADLNKQLQSQLQNKKQRKEKRRLKDQPYIYITIMVLLVLIVICFILMRKYLHFNGQ